MSKTSTLRTNKEEQATCDDIPLPIVKLNRWTLVVGVLSGLVLQWPLLTTALFLILLPAVIYGQRGSLIFQVGKRLLVNGKASPDDEPGEDRRLMRFNNAIATVLLGLAQVAFLAGLPVFGWVLSSMLVLAAGAALMGHCLGCVLYYRFRKYRYRLFGAR